MNVRLFSVNSLLHLRKLIAVFLFVVSPLVVKFKQKVLVGCVLTDLSLHQLILKFFDLALLGLKLKHRFVGPFFVHLDLHLEALSLPCCLKCARGLLPQLLFKHIALCLQFVTKFPILSLQSFAFLDLVFVIGVQPGYFVNFALKLILKILNSFKKTIFLLSMHLYFFGELFFPLLCFLFVLFPVKDSLLGHPIHVLYPLLL